MTSFVHIEYSNQHPGVSRVESAIDNAQQAGIGFSGTRGLATVLLSAIAASVMLVAYKLMGSVAEGNLMLLWLGVWFAAFAVMALFAGTARRLALRLKTGLDTWSRSIAEARADERMWAVAKSDARVMADLQIAQTRSEGFSEPVVAKPTIVVRKVSAGGAVLRAYQRNYI